MEPKYFASGVLRNSKGEYLALHHFTKATHPWRFVGGKIEPNESPLMAVAREIKEEIGIMPFNLRFAKLTAPVDVDGGQWAGYFFLCRDECIFPLISIQEPDKFDKLAWLTPEKLKALGAHPEYEVAMQIEEEGLYKW